MLSIISFTEQGIRLSKTMGERLDACETHDYRYQLYTKYSGYDQSEAEIQYVDVGISLWAKEQFQHHRVLVFIGACGIAVRAIAKHLRNKLEDSPVLVVDEKGTYVIPLLSGHMGGANELALAIAGLMDAVPVITTATDIRRKFAIDLFAKRNGLYLVNKDDIAKVSAKVLAGDEIRISVGRKHRKEEDILPRQISLEEYPPKGIVDVLITSDEVDHTEAMLLKPKEYIIGIGCRRGKTKEELDAFIENNLRDAGVDLRFVYALASIDVKQDEAGIIDWCQENKIPFQTFSAEELKKVEGDFSGSEFVRQQVGVDNVCERAALKACKSGGELVYRKHAARGMTIAIAKRRWLVAFDESELY